MSSIRELEVEIGRLEWKVSNHNGVIKELQADIQIWKHDNISLSTRLKELEEDRDNWKRAAKVHARTVLSQEARLECIQNIGHEVHSSWNTSKEFANGWRECRKQIDLEVGDG